MEKSQWTDSSSRLTDLPAAHALPCRPVLGGALLDRDFSQLGEDGPKGAMAGSVMLVRGEVSRKDKMASVKVDRARSLTHSLLALPANVGLTMPSRSKRLDPA